MLTEDMTDSSIYNTSPLKPILIKWCFLCIVFVVHSFVVGGQYIAYWYFIADNNGTMVCIIQQRAVNLSPLNLILPNQFALSVV